MGHAISNLALGVGQSFLCRGEGVGYVFFINLISKCSGPPHPILFDQSLKIQLFYMKKQLSYKHIFCKKAAFLQKYISVKKVGYLHKKGTFLRKYVFAKKQYFYNRSFCKKTAFLHKNDAFFTRTVFLCNTTGVKRFKRLLVFVRSIFSKNK